MQANAMAQLATWRARLPEPYNTVDEILNQIVDDATLQLDLKGKTKQKLNHRTKAPPPNTPKPNPTTRINLQPTNAQTFITLDECVNLLTDNSKLYLHDQEKTTLLFALERNWTLKKFAKVTISHHTHRLLIASSPLSQQAESKDSCLTRYDVIDVMTGDETLLAFMMARLEVNSLNPAGALISPDGTLMVVFPATGGVDLYSLPRAGSSSDTIILPFSDDNECKASTVECNGHLDSPPGPMRVSFFMAPGQAQEWLLCGLVVWSDGGTELSLVLLQEKRVSGNDVSLHLENAVSWRIPHQICAAHMGANSLGVFVTGQLDGSIFLWGLKTRTLYLQIESTHSTPMQQLALSSTGRNLMSLASDASLHMFEISCDRDVYTSQITSRVQLVAGLNSSTFLGWMNAFIALVVSKGDALVFDQAGEVIALLTASDGLGLDFGSFETGADSAVDTDKLVCCEFRQAHPDSDEAKSEVAGSVPTSELLPLEQVPTPEPLLPESVSSALLNEYALPGLLCAAYPHLDPELFEGIKGKRRIQELMGLLSHAQRQQAGIVNKLPSFLGPSSNRRSKSQLRKGDKHVSSRASVGSVSSVKNTQRLSRVRLASDETKGLGNSHRRLSQTSLALASVGMESTGTLPGRSRGVSESNLSVATEVSIRRHSISKSASVTSARHSPLPENRDDSASVITHFSEATAISPPELDHALEHAVDDSDIVQCMLETLAIGRHSRDLRIKRRWNELKKLAAIESN